MKVGDLVELSAYGKKLKYFSRLRGHRGIILKRLHEYSIWKVHWFDKAYSIKMNRKDIKHVKAKKTLDNITQL